MKPMRKLALAYARMRYGKVPEPLQQWYAHGGVFWTWSVQESLVEASWRTLPVNIRELAVLKAASVIDCPWCLDFGSHLVTEAGVDPSKIRDLHERRGSPGSPTEETGPARFCAA